MAETVENAGQSGYQLTSSGLSDMVKDGQKGFLEAYGGVEGLASALGSNSSKGLERIDENSLAERREQFGKNYVEPPPLRSYWSLILEGLEDITIRALLVCATGVLLLVPAEKPDHRATTSIEGIAIFCTVAFVLNLQAGIEYTKAKEFRRQQLELEGDAKFKIIRGGETMETSPTEIVVGDVVRIAVGDIIPADGVLLEGTDIKIDESALTGEPILVAKNIQEPFVLSGTSVMTGSGKLLIVAVGLNSVQGRILAAVRGTEGGGSEENDPGTETNENTRLTTNIEQEEEEENKAEVNAKEVEKSNAGSNLQEKLNDTAMAIGKIGLYVATLAFLLMLGVFLGQPKKNLNLPPVEIANSIISFFLVAVTILVVAVPEGLPLAVVLSLAITMGRLMKDNNRVKHIFACETMGSATTICSDKTGTLTQNRMTIMRCLVGPSANGGTENNITEIKHDLKDVAVQLQEICSPQMLELFIQSAILNSAPTTKVSWDETTKNWKYVGNATECALLKLCTQLGAEEPDILRAQFQDADTKLDWGVKVFPFSSQRKKMSWIIQLKDGGYRLFSKGAPSGILDYTTGILSSDGKSVKPIDIDACQSAIERFQHAAMRTLALAYRDFAERPTNWDEPLPGQESVSVETQIFAAETELTLLAIVGIEDPLRPTVTRAISQCATAGVDVRMCTGDALATAIAISAQCGILRPSDMVPSNDPQKPKQPKPFFAMEGAEFDERVHVIDTEESKVMRRCFDYDTGKIGEMLRHPFKRDADGEKIINQAAFDDIWPKLRVLARCQPEDKLTLVRGLRRSKLFEDKDTCTQLEKRHNIHIFPDYQVVAVTGDGTNDAPALKAANVGFAMGLVGTDIAKQACDIILLDDNFASTVAAVKWGRNVYESISKFCQFQLTVNIAALCAALIGALLFGRSPLAATQMLWVNVIMDSLASIALASEPPTEALLERSPYGKQRRIITRTMWINMLGQAAYQVTVMCLILFYRPLTNDVFDIKSAKSRRNRRFVKIIFNLHGTELEEQNHDIEMGTAHFTIVFNTFVLMTLMNEFNARKLQTVYRLKTTWHEWNVFEGIHRNPLFILILVITFGLQAILIQFSGLAFKVRKLTANQWGYCFLFGVGSIPVQFLINLVNLATAPAIEFKNSSVSLAAAAATATSNSAVPEEKTADNNA